MLAGSNSTPSSMLKALEHTIRAFDISIKMEGKYSDEDKAFFTARRALLAPTRDKLKEKLATLAKIEDDEEVFCQMQVKMGDAFLDEGFRDGNAVSKAALRGKPGLPASHAFGKNIDDTVNAPVAEEPELVLKAASRIDALPDFTQKAEITDDLIKRANLQKGFLNERAQKAGEKDKINGEITPLVNASADALASAKGAMDERFPRRKKLVSAFFLDVRSQGSPEHPMATAIISVLKARKIQYTQAQRRKILSQKDAEVLGRWLSLSMSVGTIEELLPEEQKP